jgi:hypothetical protein
MSHQLPQRATQWSSAGGGDLAAHLPPRGGADASPAIAAIAKLQ